ncbi:MAG TPA: ABC transporter permease [Candidatus Angelobacter sp.]|nr:ABC transporter permease [Candidatus Angelobacter sp.]
MNDLKFAFRQLQKNPGFTAVAVLTLALGIGAATALFSVVYGVLISPYPYARPGEIWTPGLHSASANQRMRPYRPNEYLQMTKLSAFSDVMATGPGNVLLTGEFDPESIRAIRVSGNAFQFLGVPPLFGRTIQPSDIRPTGEPELVTVLSFRRWQKLFGNDTNILGKTLRLDDQPHTIIGVMSPRFGWWTDDGVWLPMGIDSRDQRGVFPIIRLSPGVSSAAAQQQLHALQLELAKMNPSGFPKDEFATSLTNYLDITAASGEMQRSLQLLLGAVGFLLLIACANVANLQLARATSRSREMAIRLSIGAGRSQIVRQLLTESVLVSLLGGALGLLFAFWITRLMLLLMPGFYVPNEARIEVNGYVLFFSLIISVVTGILFGLVPALQSSRPNLVEALKDESRGSAASAGGKTRSLLVIAEVALSVVLLVSAGLTIRSFVALQKVELGFRPERVMTVNLPLPPKHYATWDQRNRFAEELLERAKNLPGVQAVTIGNGGLPFGGPSSAFAIEGQTDTEARQIMLQLVSADYLSTVGVPLRQGRMLTEREIKGSQNVAVINEAAVKFWAAGENPIGRRLRLDLLEKPGGPVLTPTNSSPYVTIVGVVGNTRNDDLRNDPQPAVLLPYTLLAPPGRTLALRTRGDPKSLMNALRMQVREMDKEQPINGPTTFEEEVGFRTAQPRFIMALFSLFAALGLALALAGIYSVLSYLVTRRTHEIGVRMALGARRGDVLRLIFKTGGRLVGLGLVVGVIASFGVARMLGSQIELFQVRAADPVSFLGVMLLLGAVAMVACYIPARRATKVDPMNALRYE